MHTIETKKLLLTKSVPSLSDAAIRLMGMSNDTEVGPARIVAVLSSDKDLSARILMIANSPLFRPISPIRDIHSAVVRLGVPNTVELATSVAVLRATGGRMPAEAQAVRRHSVAIGAIGRVLRHEYEMIAKSGNSFISGVVGDIGLITLVRNKWMSVGQDIHDDASCEVERRAVGFSHADLSADVLRKWRVPSDVVALVAEHHDQAPSQADPVAHELLRVASSIERGLASGKGRDEILADAEQGGGCDSVPPSRLAELWPRLMDVRSELGALAN